VHSRYERCVADLPWQGCAVRLQLRTRRWFCGNAACPRRIFTERLPAVVAPHARRTARLAAVVEAIAFALGGEPGARVLAAFGLRLSGATLLNTIRAAPEGSLVTPAVLGVDDYAMRRGRVYGTILVDLQRRRPVDLLPDRSAETFAAWLAAHPGVTVIARDCGGAYADGGRQGAPDALQVADRWHVLANFGDLLERLLVRHHAALRQVRYVPAAPDRGDASPPPTQGDAVDEERIPLRGAVAPAGPAGLPRRERDRQERNARREARYQAIHALHGQGHSVRAICRHLHLHQATVTKYLAAPTCPHPGPRPTRSRWIAPYVPYLRERWEAGERRPKVLWAELRARGFTGAWRRVQEQLTPWRRALRSARPGPPPAPAQRRPPTPAGTLLAPRHVAALLARPAAARTPAQAAYLEALLQLAPALEPVQALAQEFGRLVRERDPAGLAAWLGAAEAMGLAEVREFALGLRRDLAAVTAALREPWSSGQVEGQNTRLKLLKRQGYGRQRFDLLRRRVLRAA
jgi:transposase